MDSAPVDPQRTGAARAGRSRQFTVRSASEASGFPYEIHADGELIGQIKSRTDADIICRGRHSALREAGNRAADLRRYDLEQRRMKNDIKALMQGLQMAAHVLKQRRPREVLRAREEIRQLLRRMHGQGYTA